MVPTNVLQQSDDKLFNNNNKFLDNNLRYKDVLQEFKNEETNVFRE